MAPKTIEFEMMEEFVVDARRNIILRSISITLLTLLFIFFVKLIIINFVSDRNQMTDEITTILSCCAAVNIVAYIFLYRYRLLTHKVALATADFIKAYDKLHVTAEEQKHLEPDLLCIK